MATWDWSNEGDLDLAVNVVSSLEPNRSALERRFPSCLCVAAVPRNVDEVVVMTCTATMTNGTVWSVSWPLARWKEITPVFLQQKVGVLARQIRVRTEDPCGNALEVPVSVYDKIRRVTIPVTDGTCWLTPGSYRVVLGYSGPWLKSRFGKPDFEVGPESPPGDTVFLRASEALHRVAVRLNVEPLGADAMVRVRFRDAAHTNSTVIRQPSEQGTWAMFLPTGKYMVQAEGLHYASKEQEVLVEADMDLALTLERVVR